MLLCCLLILLIQFSTEVYPSPILSENSYDKCFIDNSLLSFSNVTESLSFSACISLFMDMHSSSDNNVNFTKDEVNYLKSLEREGINILEPERRNKRQIFPHFRRRKECRAMNRRERDDLFSTIRQLKFGRYRRYDTLANFHRGRNALRNAHGGSNFFGWHRVYLFLFENALRRILPVTLCYWDSTTDFIMPGATQRNSISFSSDVFGNGVGTVITGYFREWPLPRGGRLRRSVGNRGSLMRPEIVDMVLYNASIIRNTQITTGGEEFDVPNSLRKTTLEAEHGNPHNWVGEVMNDLQNAPQDPVFFFHHAFIDYCWERFREKQIRHGVNPMTDYPGIGGTRHTPNTPMTPFSNIHGRYVNIFGYSNYFNFIRYDNHPTCGNSCGGATGNLYCPAGGAGNDRCMSFEREIDIVTTDDVGFGSRQVVSRDDINQVAKREAQKEGALVSEGPAFPMTYDDPRLKDTNTDLAGRTISQGLHGMLRMAPPLLPVSQRVNDRLHQAVYRQPYTKGRHVPLFLGRMTPIQFPEERYTYSRKIGTAYTEGHKKGNVTLPIDVINEIGILKAMREGPLPLRGPKFRATFEDPRLKTDSRSNSKSSLLFK